MRGLLKSKRVSWPSDGNLSQVRLFLSEDSPSQVGLGDQGHLQAKASWMLHSRGMGLEDKLPPGFEETSPANQLMNRLSQIPLSKWRCPPRFLLNFTWQVVAGEESKEKEVENHREMRVLEAIYPRPSSIPQNPSLAVDVEGSPHDDRLTLLIPLTPIEEEGSMETLPDLVTPLKSPSTEITNLPAYKLSPTAGLGLAVEHSVIAAASAATTAMMESSNQGSMIDHSLLMQILGDPKLVEKLVKDPGSATTNSHTGSKPISMTPANFTDPPSLAGTSNGSFYIHHPPNAAVRPAPTPARGAPMVRDMSYFKSLIQKHGGDRQDVVPQAQGSQEDSVNNLKPRPKKNMPCMYFNSSRGCRRANCAYLHDSSALQRHGVDGTEMPSAKRIKMDREIAGTHYCN